MARALQLDASPRRRRAGARLRRFSHGSRAGGGGARRRGQLTAGRRRGCAHASRPSLGQPGRGRRAGRTQSRHRAVAGARRVDRRARRSGCSARSSCATTSLPRRPARKLLSRSLVDELRPRLRQIAMAGARHAPPGGHPDLSETCAGSSSTAAAREALVVWHHSRVAGSSKAPRHSRPADVWSALRRRGRVTPGLVYAAGAPRRAARSWPPRPTRPCSAGCRLSARRDSRSRESDFSRPTRPSARRSRRCSGTKRGRGRRRRRCPPASRSGARACGAAPTAPRRWRSRRPGPAAHSSCRFELRGQIALHLARGARRVAARRGSLPARAGPARRLDGRLFAARSLGGGTRRPPATLAQRRARLAAEIPALAAAAAAAVEAA